MSERPSFTRFMATDILWWAGWFLLSYIVGWSISDQLASPWFWAVALALTAWSVYRWRRLDPADAAARSTRLGGGHHREHLPSGGRALGASETVRRSLIVFVIVAGAGLLLSTLFVDTGIAEGRTLLLGEEFVDAGYAAWSTTVSSIDAEIFGLTVYDYSFLVGMAIIAIEMVALFARPRTDRKLWFQDSLVSISTQIPFYVVEIFTVLAMLGAYFVIWDHLTLWQLPVNLWTIVLGVVAADFAYYWEHRTSHEVRVLWTGHAVHHSSPVFNTAVAFRFGPFEPVLAVLFHLPLVLLGLHPAIVIAGELTVQAYQFWIHTEVIGRLGPLDRVLNTPSNHRVHHGSDEKYLDRNHGGILMIWDRMFGTYQAEEETPTYGLTTPINTVNPLKVWFSEFPALFADLRAAPTWRVWWGHLLNRPGWRPPT